MSCKRFVGGSVLTLFAAVLLLAPVGCGSPSPEPGAEAAGAGPVSIGEGDPAPAFTLEDLEGNPVHLADSTGQVRLLDFWATWCAPCREEIPMLNELHEKFSDQGLFHYSYDHFTFNIIIDCCTEYNICAWICCCCNSFCSCVNFMH